MMRTLQIRPCLASQGSNVDETVAEPSRIFVKVAWKPNLRLIVGVVTGESAPVRPMRIDFLLNL